MMMISNIWHLLLILAAAMICSDHRISATNQTIRFNELKSAVKEPIDKSVDFNIRELDRVYHGGNACPFRRAVLNKMMKSEQVEILIVGGSVTNGGDLEDRLKWSKRFIDILSSGWYTGNISVLNIGVPGCDLDGWIDRVNEFKDFDMVIIDLSVNDQGYDMRTLPQRYHTFLSLIDSLPKHPAVLVNYAFRSALNDISDMNRHCPNPSNQGKCCGGNYHYCQRWWEMQDYSAMTFNKLRIPFVSYRDLVWPDYAHPPANLPVYWNGKSHPDFRAHMLMAKLIAFGFMMQVQDALDIKGCDLDEQSNYIRGSDAVLKWKPLCPNPLTLMRASDDLTSLQNFNLAGDQRPLLGTTVNNWRYYNDSKMKFGWVLESSSDNARVSCAISNPNHAEFMGSKNWCLTAFLNHTLSLEVVVGEDPVIRISYLKSYTDIMGKVLIWIDTFINESVLMDGRWDSRHSITKSFTIVGRKNLLPGNLTSALVGEHGVLETLAKISPGKHILHISAYPLNGPQYKWKLLEVTSC